jgi:hypothetical protein
LLRRVFDTQDAIRDSPVVNGMARIIPFRQISGKGQFLRYFFAVAPMKKALTISRKSLISKQNIDW